MGISENKKKSPAALITYALAVVFLLLGLALPLFAGKGMLAAQLPQIFNDVAKDRIFDFGKAFESGHTMQLFGKGKEFDFTAWILLIYALVTVAAAICLIPAGLSYKKADPEGDHPKGKACVRIAYVFETAALAVISLYFIVHVQDYIASGHEMKLSYSLLIAFGGVALMLVILSCMNKGLTGGVKLVLALLSAFALLMLFDMTALLPAKAASGWTKVAGKLKCSPLLYGAEEYSTEGMGGIAMLFEETPLLSEMFKGAGSAKNKALLVLTLIVALVVVINYFIDLISLSSNAKTKGLMFNCIRYCLEVLAIVCLFVTGAVCKVKPGFALSLIIIAAGIQLIISIARLVPVLVKNKADKPEEEKVKKVKKVKKNKKGVEDDSEVAYTEDNGTFGNYNASPFPYAKATYGAPADPVEENDYEPEEYEPEPEPEYKTVQDYFREPEVPEPEYKPEPEPAPRPEPEPVREENSIPVHNVYNTYMPNIPVQEAPRQPDRIYRMNTVYQGPTDEFMRKLSNEEKIEFSMIFIEKTKGDTGKVPDYIIGGDNRKFFSSVFIYLGKLRSLVSDGLLNKMYKELNMF